MVPAALAAALLVLGACGSEATQEPAGAEAAGDSKSSPEAAGPTEEMITATEYEFDAPQTLAAGEVTLNFHNAGKEPHEMLVFRINDESSVEELLKLPQKEAMKHITEVGAAFAKPGRTAKKPLTADLEAGRYAMVCFVPAPDKTPHAFKGMVAEFQVTQ
jgi:hypothetical protein